MQNFTQKDLLPLNTMSVEEAKRHMHSIIDMMCPPLTNHPINPEKAVRLRGSIDKADTVYAIQKIGWNILLAGFKLGNSDSKYQKDFKGSKRSTEIFGEVT